MLEIKIDKRELERMAKGTTASIRKAMTSVLKSESNRLRGELQRHARMSIMPEVSPTTKALSKKRIGPYLSRFMSYEVDEPNLSAQVGIRTQGAWAVKPSLALLAAKQAGGYRIRVTAKAQRRLAGRLQGKHKKLTRLRAWGQVGGLKSFIPRIGLHESKARPIVEVVWARERARTLENIKRNFAIKMAGGRY